MFVKEGSNYASRRAKQMIRIARESPLSDFKWHASINNRHILIEPGRKDTYYYLVESDHDLKALIKSDGDLELSSFVKAKDFVGFIAVNHLKLDEIHILWLAQQWQGQGLGSGLIRLAYAQSKRGLTTSDNIGTMFLACVWRVYQKERKMELIYEGQRLPRNKLKTTGTEIWYNKTNLCDPEGPDFWLEWRK